MKGKRFILWSAAGLLFLILVHELLVMALAAGIFSRKYHQDAFGYARMSVRPVAEAYARYHDCGYYKFKELVTDVMRMNPDLSRLSLVDVAGRVLFDSREFEAGLPAKPETISQPELLLAVKSMDLSCRMTRDERGQACMDIVAPYIEEWGQHRLSARYQIRYYSWGDQQSSFWARMMLAGLISFVLGLLVIVLVTPKVCRDR